MLTVYLSIGLEISVPWYAGEVKMRTRATKNLIVRIGSDSHEQDLSRAIRNVSLKINLNFMNLYFREIPGLSFHSGFLSSNVVE